MNRAFRLVWNDALGAFVAVAEHARARGKGRTGTRGTLASLALAGAALAAQAQAQAQAQGTPPPSATALPSGGSLAAGQAQWAADGARLQVNQSSAKAVINWQRFDIGAQAEVRFQQPDASAVTLNRVVGADLSQVMGRLSANGQLLLVNPNGIVFGQGAQVHAAGLAASTLQIQDEDFLAGRLRFQQGGQSASVLNQGTLEAAAGGYIALLAPEVRNEGVLRASRGSVALAGGDHVTLQVDGTELLGVQVSAARLQTLIDNRLAIEAEGGQIFLAAGVARQLLQQAVAGGDSASATALVEQEGVLRLVSNSGSLTAQGGRVQVQGGNLSLSGSISAREGGQVALQGEHMGQSGQIDVGSTLGRGGQVQVQAETVVQTAQARINADGGSQGGQIRITGSTGNTGAGAPSTLFSSGRLSAQASAGQGGQIDLSATDVQLRAATLDASGTTGGGRVRVGGGFQGGDADLGNAARVGINASTQLKADASGARGDGGQVVVWSDDKTVFGGQISARGGSQAGAGGQAEVSGRQDLVFQGQADLSSRDGRPGQLLLDPRNILVDEAGNALASLNLADPTPSGSNGFGSVVRVLGNGHVVITAPLASTGGQAATGAVYLFDSQNGALLADLRGSHANDQAGSAGLQVLDNDNYLVLSPRYGTVGGVNVFSLSTNDSNSAPSPSAYEVLLNTTASAGAITWQSGAGSGSNAIGSGNSLVGDTGLSDSQRRYGYTGNTLTMLSRTAITANDQLGKVSSYDQWGGLAEAGTTTIHTLSDGNLAIATPNWFNGRGAVTWMNSQTGALANAATGGVVSASTSVVGDTPIRTQGPLATDSDGKMAWVIGLDQALPYNNSYNGNSRRSTAPGAAGDFVGQSLTALPGGGYVIASPLWSNGGTSYVGAVTHAAAGGGVGAVSTSNSLVGSSAFDFVGSGGVFAVGSTGANYVVSSPYWSDAGNPAAGKYLQNNPNGAVTWVDGSTGHVFGSGSAGAAVSTTNSLIGNAGAATGGLSSGATSPETSRSEVTGVGTSYVYSTRRTASGPGVTVLPNGHYLVVNDAWNGARGAVAFGQGNTGLAGAISASNSLVGNTAGDRVGTRVLTLSGSHYLVLSPDADLGAVDGGAATWGSGTSGVTGALSASNSLYTTAAGSRIGSGGALAVGAADGQGLRANAIVLSPQWGNRSSGTSNVAYGAVTWIDGSTGLAWGQGSAGVQLSASNSLVGSAAGDYVGSFHYADTRLTSNTSTLSNLVQVEGGWNAVLSASVDLLSNGDYVVRSASWGGGRGAITWGSGASGMGGAVGASNSLVGSTADVYSPSNSVSTRAGMSFTDTTFRLTTTGDHVGLLGQALADGHYLAVSPYWSTGRGAITWVGSSQRSGVVSAANSLVGSTPDVYSDANQSALVSAGDRLGTLPNTQWVVPVVSETTVGGRIHTSTGLRPMGPFGMVTATGVSSHTFYSGGGNVLLGQSYSTGVPRNGTVTYTSWNEVSSGFQYNLFPIVQPLANGNVLVASPGWANGSALRAGAITWVDGRDGSLVGGGTGGTLSAGNSLVGSHAGDLLGFRLPLDGVAELSNGNFLLLNPQWHDERGAVTWGSGTAGVAGTVSADNSLVGSTGASNLSLSGVYESTFRIIGGVDYNADWVDRRSNLAGDRVGYGGVTLLADGHAVVGSPLWGQSSPWTQTDAPQSLGAVTWVNGQTGQLVTGAAGGSLSAANSLVGSQPGDAVGYSPWVDPYSGQHHVASGVTALGGGAYAVASPWWSQGSAQAVGAVTFAAAGGLAGTVSAANSLVGGTAGDQVGLSLSSIDYNTFGIRIDPGVAVLNTSTGTHYVVRSVNWTNPYGVGDGQAAAGAGAVTWVNGQTGHAYGEGRTGAVVSVHNSLVGSAAGDAVGSPYITLTREVNGQQVDTGDLLLLSNLAYCDVWGAGAVTLLSGSHGASGLVNWRNSLIGLASAADGLNTSSYTGDAYASDIRATLLPTAVSGSEQVAWRPLVWAAPNGGTNASQAVALTLVGDDPGVAQASGTLNGIAGHASWSSPLFASDGAGFAGVGGNPGSGVLAFSANTGSDLVITPAALTALLNAGTSVTLQASNDITVLRDIAVSANGQGGHLTLEAGRSVHLRANISTDNGNFSAIANQSVANGVVDGDCSSCVSIISQAAGTAIDAGTGQVRLQLLASSDKTSNAAGTVRVATLDGSQLQVANAGANAGGEGRGIRFNDGAVLGGSDTERIELYARGNSAAGGGLVPAADTRFVGTDQLKVGPGELSQSLVLGAASGGALAMTASEIGAVIRQSSGFGSYQFGRGEQSGATVIHTLDFSQPGMRPAGSTALAADLDFTGGSGGVQLSGTLTAGLASGHGLGFTAWGGGIVLGASASLQAGATPLSLFIDGGDLSQHASASLSADRLTLAIDGAASLGGSNRIDTLAGSVSGSAQIKTNASVAIGSAGLAARGGLVLQASGGSSDIRLDGVVSSSTGDLVLAAGRHFNNTLSLDTGLIPGNGRYLVYAAHPDTSTEGMGGYQKHYAQSYSAGTTPSYAGSGNWFLYSVAPTISVSVGAGGSIVYGQSGAVPGLVVGGLIDGDSLASATTGALNASTSAYTPSSAGFIPAGSYTLSLNGPGTLTSPLGYVINLMPGSSSFSVMPKALTVGGLSAANKVYDGSTAAQVTGAAHVGGHGSSASDGLVMAGDAVSLVGSASGDFADRHAGTGKSVTLAGLSLSGADAGNYAISAGSVLADITPKALGLSGLAVAASKVYDGGTGATLLGTPALLVTQAAGSGSPTDGRAYTGDAVALSGQASGSYDSSQVAAASRVQFAGLGLSGAEAGNYTLSLGTQAATITPKALTVSGASAVNKVYDGLGSAAVSGGSLVGLVGSDQASLSLAGSFAGKNAGTGLPVTVSGSLSGADAANYSLTLPTGLSADITPKAIGVAGAAVDAKTYDGSLSASVSGGSLQGLVSGDDLGFSLSGLFADKNAGTSKAVALSGSLSGADAANYSLTLPTGLSADITPKAIGVAGAAVDAKTYDGGLNASVSGGSLQGLVSGDDLGFSLSGLFADKNAGTGKAVTLSGSLSGVDAANYSLTLPTGLSANITPRAVSVSGASVAAKVYDGSTEATVLAQGLLGLVAGDQVSVQLSGQLADKNAGQDKAVQVSGQLGGADGANYSLVLPTGLSVSVGIRMLDLQGLAALDKVYDGGTEAWFNTLAVQWLGLAAGDDVGLAISGRFADKNVGQAKPIAVQAALTGTDAANYQARLPTLASADITPKALTVAGVQAQTKVYDGSTAATLDTSALRLDGLVAGDQVRARVSGAFADANAGSAKAVRLDTLLQGADLANYRVSTQDGTSADITPRGLLLQAQDARKTYGDADPVLGLQLVGQDLASGDSLATVLSGQLATAAGAAATAGRHAIGLGTVRVDANYRITGFVPATLQVDPAPLAVQLDAQTKVYGAAEPALSWTVDASQLRYADTVAVVEMLGIHTASGAQATAGTHAISGQARADNYVVTVRDGTLTVAKAPLTLRADDQSKTAGEQDPALSWRLDPSQLRYADTADVVQGAQLQAPGGAGLAPGSYPIRLSGASAQNYVLLLQDGVLTVKASPAVRSENLQNQATSSPGVVPTTLDTGRLVVLQVPAPPAGTSAMGPAGSLTVVANGLAGSPVSTSPPTPSAAAAVVTGSPGETGFAEAGNAGAAMPVNPGADSSADSASAAGARAADAVRSSPGAEGVAAALGARLSVVVPISQASLADLGQGVASEHLFSPPPGEKLNYSATLADGRPLPAWLKIDSQSGQLQGLPPDEASLGTIEVTVQAKTRDGQAASARLRLGSGTP